MSEYTFSDYAGWSTTSKSNGYHIKNSNPVDDRYVVDTYGTIETKIGDHAYPGLHVYVIDAAKEYWFVGGNNNGNSLQLVEYRPWIPDISSSITYSINQLKQEKPWMSDISSGGEGGGGEGTVINTPTVIPLDANSCSKDGVPNYLVQNIGNPTPGQEVSVVYTDNGIDTFTKYVYLNGYWCISCGSQTITFKLNTYENGNWDAWNPPANGPNVTYNKGDAGTVTVYVKHGFCTQYVDTTLYLNNSSLDDNNDGKVDPYGEELLAGTKCITLSVKDSNNTYTEGFWVRIELQIPSHETGSPQELTYTLLLQR